jgi:hypothetical protein
MATFGAYYYHSVKINFRPEFSVFFELALVFMALLNHVKTSWNLLKGQGVTHSKFTEKFLPQGEIQSKFWKIMENSINLNFH